MSKQQRWIKTAKWHAWPHGGRRTVCGTVTVEDLRNNPAEQIADQPPADGDICRPCARSTSRPVASSLGDTVAASWAGHLRRHLKRQHARIAEDTLRELAQRLAEVGSPDMQDARDVFDQVKVLLLTPMRTTKRKRNGSRQTVVTIPHLRDALSKLPPKTAALAQVAMALRCWRTITRRDPTADHFRSDRVIEIMLQIPAPEAYIRHLTSRGLPNLGAMFHPNTLARAKRETALRGLFSGTTEYWNATANQLRIVEE